MKKLALLALLALSTQGMRAGNPAEDLGVFNHLSLGVTLGTTGIGFDVATPVTRFFQLRAGYSFMPKFSYKTDVNYKVQGYKLKTPVEGKFSLGDAKVLIDFYPIKSSPFHATVGAYIGKSEIADVQNTTPIAGLAPGEGLEIGDYVISPDRDGIARATIEVKSFKPYVGLGYGRSVPKGRVSVSGDLGVQFWGTPTMYENMSGSKHKLTTEDTGNSDGGFIKTMSKITVYPVLTIRVAGKIF